MTSTLTPLELHVLVALADEPAHGYAIVRRIESDSGGRLCPLPGNLYTVIRRVVDRGLVEERRPPRAGPGRAQDPRRRYYGLTRRGRELLHAEVEHLEGLAGRLRTRLAD